MSPAADNFLLEMFRAELETHARVLAQESADASVGGTERIDAWARAAQAIKGAARMVGVEPIVGLTRAIEEALAAVRNRQAAISSRLTQALNEAGRLMLKLAEAPPAEIPTRAEAQGAEIAGLSRKFKEPTEASTSRAQVVSQRPPAASVPADLAELPMLDLFRMELETHAQALETGLVAVEGETQAEKIEPLMRAAHSIKGAARMVGLDLAVGMAHAMEDVLAAAQRGKWKLESQHIDRLLQATDCFSSLSRVVPADIPATLEAEKAKYKALEQSLAALMTAGESAPAPAISVAPAAPPSLAAQPAEAQRSEQDSVRVFADNLNRLMGLAGECLVQTKSVRPLSAALQRIKQGQYSLMEALNRARQSLAEMGSDEELQRAQELCRHGEQLHDLTLRHLAEFDQFTRRLERLSNRLYDEALATRMRPFADALHGYPRMIRDLARSLGKSVRLVIENPETQVDRDILEKLEAPLTHLLRNAVDHGMEMPEQRLAAGKPAEGRLTLAARHVAGILDITVSDDGAGISIEGLRRKVVASGYAAEEMASKLSNAELLEFLFLPGFSTRSEVSELSGRGVGLNIVQAMAHQVGGSARVTTELGKGTAFHLQLPLTLSVVRSLLLEIGGQIYALPLAQVERVFRMARAEIRVVEDRQFCMMDGASVGIIDATQVLQLQTPPRANEMLHIVAVGNHLNRYGLAVDRFAGERDLVVIPLDRRLGKVANISAGAILEDGSPVLILDVEDLVRSIDSLLTRGGLKKLREQQAQKRTTRKRILVVDDSLTVRETERRLLENGGYDVSVAIDGMEGWNALREGRFDLLVTDVDMPRLDGIELVRRLRAWPPTGSLPVVIVSYKDQAEYRMKGLDAGANAYLTKSSFHDAGLLNTVRDLIGDAGEPS